MEGNLIAVSVATIGARVTNRSNNRLRSQDCYSGQLVPSPNSDADTQDKYNKALKQIIHAAYLLALGNAHSVLLDAGSELVLIDAGFADKADVVWKAVEQLGRKRQDIRHLIFTHGHPDHVGSAAAIVRETGATTYMHALDASLAETDGPVSSHVAIARVAAEDRLSLRMAAGGADGAVHDRPPHCRRRHAADSWRAEGYRHAGHRAGQVALLCQGGRLLIAGDVGMNIIGLGEPVGFEDEAEGRRSQRKIATLRFEAAAFGHGSPIRSGASNKVRKKWGLS